MAPGTILLAEDPPPVGSTVRSGRDARDAGSSDLVVETVLQEMWETLRDVRLRALENAPHAFVGEVAEEAARSQEEWRSLIHNWRWVVARAGADDVVGVARLFRAQAKDHVEWFVESVWVDDDWRKHGVSRRMLSVLEETARHDGATCVRLWVLESNLEAWVHYERLGYRDALEEGLSRKPDGSGGYYREKQMVKPLL